MRGNEKQRHGTATSGNAHTIESKRRDNLRKDILVQYCDLQQEAKDIRKRIEKTQARLNRIQRGGTVLDSVSGTRADGTIGSIRIEGFPFGDFNTTVQASFHQGGIHFSGRHGFSI